MDELGNPATNAPVQLMRAAYFPEGKTYRVIKTVNTDDRGEYRLFDIAPGRYILRAGNSPGPGSIGRSAGTTSYAVSFYPGVSDVVDASTIEIKPAAEVRVNVTVKRQQLYRIRGRLMDSSTGKAPAIAAITLTYPGGSMSSSNSYNQVMGTFEVVNVPSGSFSVQAQTLQPSPLQSGPPQDAAAAQERRALQASWPTGQISVKVTNSDVEGLVLTLTTGISVRGHMKLDGDNPLSNLPGFERIRVDLRSATDGIIETPYARLNPAPRAPDVNGDFHVEGVKPGEYAVVFSEIPTGYYVKSLRYGALEVLNQPLRFIGSTEDALEVILRPGAAVLKGVVTDAKSQPVSGVEVILIPEVKLRNHTELFKTTVTNRNGEFTTIGIPPGDYKVFSWEALEPEGYFDSDFMKRYEEQGVAIHLENAGTATVDVKIIPAE